ncbi:MAG: dihydroorotase [Flavobacteriia bacterium]|nr:dihydroorotase [Flavobacteriia bacterium]
MTSILLRKAHVVDPRSPYNGQTVDIRIVDEQIIAIGEALEAEKGEEEVNLEGLSVSPGWVEMHSDFADPGQEERETLQSGSMAALRGGFSTVCLTPNTAPIIQSKSDIEYIYAKGQVLPVNLYPIGALSRDMKGEEMTEMFDMFSAGAVAFSDNHKPITNPNLLKMALLYSKTAQMPVVDFPFEPKLANDGQMNEGHTGTYLGLKGIPNLSEELIVARDIELCAYTEGALHLSRISTAGSVERIRQAKANGLNITCDVNLYNLLLTDSALHEYDSFYKVLPPLRSEEDRKALIQGVNDGTIDAIAVDHNPMDVERKKCEFQHASFGMAYIEQAFGLYGAELSKEITLETWVECLTHGPRMAYNLGPIEIVEGAPAELTVFDPKTSWTAVRADSESLAYNQPFLGKPLQGRAFGIFNKGEYFKTES